ncbi:hypothetical protein RY831_01475 [Noviherbaspirillum sp. CPCC 100848]|uniref:Secreted protein n=1 Tax=Noviherbaspirillum album TaxID=3080276 RepID=A0ABU6J3B8_9BURK|nr:hypothetical protein [Noviherbaspirillum sp. CPCC 100848]
MLVVRAIAGFLQALSGFIAVGHGRGRMVLESMTDGGRCGRNARTQHEQSAAGKIAADQPEHSCVPATTHKESD